MCFIRGPRGSEPLEPRACAVISTFRKKKKLLGGGKKAVFVWAGRVGQALGNTVGDGIGIKAPWGGVRKIQ